MLSPKEIQEQMIQKLEELDLIVEPYSLAVAEDEKMDNMKEHTLSVIMSKSDEKSEAAKRRMAILNDEYLNWVQKKFESNISARSFIARRNNLERWLDALRSFLSHETRMGTLTK